jgi:hypothetical protein
VRSFQTALHKLQLGRFKDNKNIFASRNELAFIVSDVPSANSLLRKPASALVSRHV